MVGRSSLRCVGLVGGAVHAKANSFFDEELVCMIEASLVLTAASAGCLQVNKRCFGLALVCRRKNTRNASCECDRMIEGVLVHN